MITQLFACGGMVASSACGKTGAEAPINLDPNSSADGPGANPIAAVLPISQVYFPITAAPLPELTRCSEAQMQDATEKGCVYPVDASVQKITYLGSATACCPPLSSEKDELPYCTTGPNNGKTTVGLLSRGCVFPAPGVPRVSPDADVKEVCCNYYGTLINETSERCGYSLSDAVAKGDLYGCDFPLPGVPTKNDYNDCCPTGASLADSAVAAAIAGVASAGLTGERPTCSPADVLAMQTLSLGQTPLTGCFFPKNASVPRVDPAKGVTNFCCPAGDSTATVDPPSFQQ